MPIIKTEKRKTELKMSRWAAELLFFMPPVDGQKQSMHPIGLRPLNTTLIFATRYRQNIHLEIKSDVASSQILMKNLLSRFSGTEVEVNLDHFHPFGSPVYVLKANLQSLKSHNKWEDRLRVGIFM
jgi:hypothetical protein